MSVLNIASTDSIDTLREKHALNPNALYVKLDNGPVTLRGITDTILNCKFDKSKYIVFWIHYGTFDEIHLQIIPRYFAALAQSKDGQELICLVGSLGFMPKCDEIHERLSKKYPNIIIAISKPIVDFRERRIILLKNGNKVEI